MEVTGLFANEAMDVTNASYTLNLYGERTDMHIMLMSYYRANGGRLRTIKIHQLYLE